jgi:peptidoglycan/xylan/chitin deacetylase (PgdA/CDA1 family)
MGWYSAKVPSLLTKVFSQYLWHGDRDAPLIHLTFDDGPNPEITPWVLDKLKEYNVKATFFCIGQNVEQNQILYQRIIDEGHAVGNHTFSHMSGWKVSTKSYLNDVSKASTLIKSNLFRAPYGRIGFSQTKFLKKNYKLVMWDIMAGDFDSNNTPNHCIVNVLDNVRNGSIIVLHDSQKAKTNLKGSLDKILQGIKAKGFQFKTITSNE